MPPERFHTRGRRGRFRAPFAFRSYLALPSLPPARITLPIHPSYAPRLESSRTSVARLPCGGRETVLLSSRSRCGDGSSAAAGAPVGPRRVRLRHRALLAGRPGHHPPLPVPRPENAGLTPASFKLAFEDIAFQASDGVPLKGWWVPAPGARGTVVLVHGLNRSRIEMVKKVPFLHGAGWNALLFDLRHHGASGGKPPASATRERLDVQAARPYARARGRRGPVVYWGVSLGGGRGDAGRGRRPHRGRPRLRQHAIAACATRCATTCSSSAASAGGSASCPPGRWRPRSSGGWAGAGGFDPDAVDLRGGRVAAAGPPGPVRLQLGRPADAAGDRLRAEGGGGRERARPGGARQQPRRRLARGDGGLREGGERPVEGGGGPARRLASAR